MIADVHGNTPTVEAVLSGIEQECVDLVVDYAAAASGPLSTETLDLLASLGDRLVSVIGNADRELIEADGEPGYETVGRPGGDCCGDAAGGQHDHRGAPRGGRPARSPRSTARRWLRACPSPSSPWTGSADLPLPRHAALLRRDRDGRELRSAPRDAFSTASRLRAATSGPARVSDGVPEWAIVGGHRHVRLDRASGGRRIVSPGSVGPPCDGSPRACRAILGPGVDLRCAAYDLDAAIGRITRGGMPDAEEQICATLRTPPLHAVVVPLFEARATESAGCQKPS